MTIKKKRSNLKPLMVFSTTFGDAKHWYSIHWNQATNSGSVELGGIKMKPSSVTFAVCSFKQSKKRLSMKVELVCNKSSAVAFSKLKPYKFRGLKGKTSNAEAAAILTAAYLEKASAAITASMKKAVVSGSAEQKLSFPAEMLGGVSMEFDLRVVVLKP